MARKSSGTMRPGIRSAAAQGGTARTTTSLPLTGNEASAISSIMASRGPRVMPRRRVLSRTTVFRSARYFSAGSTKAAAKVGWAMRGR
jgi:hypothetical protein